MPKTLAKSFQDHGQNLLSLLCSASSAWTISCQDRSTWAALPKVSVALARTLLQYHDQELSIGDNFPLGFDQRCTCVLIPNWVLSKPTAFDHTVTLPLIVQVICLKRVLV